MPRHSIKNKTSSVSPIAAKSTDEYFEAAEALRISGEVGKSLSYLSLGLTLNPEKKNQFYSIYFNSLDKWCNELEDKGQFENSLKIVEVAKDIYFESPDLDYLLARSLYRWRELFRECLGNKGVNYCNEIVPLLMAVDEGIKPTLLWDVCTPDTNALLALLKQASGKGLLTSKLFVVELDLDVFIVNMNSLSRVLATILSCSPTWLVDLSSSEPKLATKEMHACFKTHMTSILTQLGQSDNSNLNAASSNHDSGSSTSNEFSLANDSAILVRLPEDTNLSTIFGCMIGYPHIYWWQGETGEKSLSGTPLKVFKLSATCSIDNNPVELFSFSIPENLEKDLRPGIEVWGNEINLCVEQAKSFTDAKFKCDSVLCLSVSL